MAPVAFYDCRCHLILIAKSFELKNISIQLLSVNMEIDFIDIRFVYLFF